MEFHIFVKVFKRALNGWETQFDYNCTYLVLKIFILLVIIRQLMRKAQVDK